MHWIIWLIIFFIIIFLILKIVKTIMKALAIITSLTIIILIIVSVIVIADISEFKNNFRYSSKMILLEDKDRMIMGVTLNGGANPIPDADLESYSDKISQRSYEEVIGRNYKLIIMNMKTVEEMDFKEITINQTVVKKSEVPTILRSNAPIKLDVFNNIVRMISDDQLFIFQQYKKGNLMVYPETPVFKLIKAIPSTFIKSLVQRSVEEVKTKVNESMS